MQTIDFIIIALYIAGLVTLGMIFARSMSNAKEMFAAGGRSPWWLSGLSAFMTMFSAGTFVVWGGISYRFGLVGVAICLTLGISALLVGLFLAGHWKRQGADSGAEFLEMRFGKSLVQFYTWLQGGIAIFTMGGAVYALSVIICALIPLSEGHLLADPLTGKLSVTLTSIFICGIVVMISMTGGLWAVLMTDVLQFIILTATTLMVGPLLLAKVGGLGAFIDKAPAGFFRPTHGEFTWWFLAGWVLVHFFKIGGEWAYIQRFTCVPTGRDARKAAFIFGAMYLISPFFWMLPPMVYQVIDPAAPHEQAYVLACQYVLPAGMMGLMIAAMSSATASTATTLLNVYAGAFTTEVYRRLINPDATDRQMVRMGRVMTLFLGVVTLAGALLIPRIGSYTGWILSVTGMLTGPIVLPTIWGLFSRRIGLGTAWGVTLVSAAAGVLAKMGLGAGGWFAGVEWLAGAARLAQINPRITEIVVGTALPLLLLLIAELSLRDVHPGWLRLEERRRVKHAEQIVMPSRLPARLCGWSVAGLAGVMAVLAVMDRKEAPILAIFAVMLALVGGSILVLTRDRVSAARG